MSRPASPPGLSLNLGLTGHAPLSPGQVICITLQKPPDSAAGPVEVALMTRVQSGGSFDQGQTDYPLLSLTVSQTLQNNNHRLQLPLALPAETPVSLCDTATAPERRDSPLWLQAKWGSLDARLPLQLCASPPMQTIFGALTANGLQLNGSHMERGTIITSYGSSTLGCYQVFDFSSRSHAEQQSPDGVSLSFISRNQSTIVRLEILAASGGGYSSILMDENWQAIGWDEVIRALLRAGHTPAPRS